MLGENGVDCFLRAVLTKLGMLCRHGQHFFGIVHDESIISLCEKVEKSRNPLENGIFSPEGNAENQREQFFTGIKCFDYGLL